MPPECGEGDEYGRGADPGDASNTGVEIPGAPSTTRHSTRTVTRPIHYGQDQEREAAERTSRKNSKTGKAKELDPGSVQDLLRGLWEANNALQQQVTKLQIHLERRDEEFQKREIEHQKAIITLQLHLKEVQQEIRTTRQETRELKASIISTQQEYTEETKQEVTTLRKEIAELSSAVRSRNGITSHPTTEGTESTGRSWASVVTPASNSSTARSTRVGLTLPMVRIDTRQASPQIKDILQDPTRLQQTISTHLRAHDQTKNIQIEGIKLAPRNLVKIFTNKDESSALLRAHQEWLQALPGVRLCGEPWFPVKLDEVRKADVYDSVGKENPTFRTQFAEENNDTQIRMIRWLSGPKSYGSMVIYVTKETDALRLLERKITHIRGEAVFTDAYRYQERPIRCRKCQVYGHKAARCPNHAVCARCAEHHMTADCEATNTRCAACRTDGHTADDRNCETWKRMKMTTQSQRPPPRAN
ncbi:hypothetical protein CBS147321_7486 [Aspergillus niger]|nr:hypothetical protein CBS147321_7486 [Aspergillus niger]